MKLYRLSDSNYELIFGSPENKKKPAITIIAQTPWCDQFLVLADAIHQGLEEIQNIPSGFNFTYCQEWGTEVTQEVIDRVISLRTQRQVS